MFSRCTIHGFTGNAAGTLQIGFLFRIDIDIVWKGHRHYVDFLQICMVTYGEKLS